MSSDTRSSVRVGSAAGFGSQLPRVLSAPTVDVGHDARVSAQAQVVANARPIAAAIEPFYGATAKDKLFELLAGHYGAVKGYLDASIAKSASGQSAATAQLLSNAKTIAEFLASHASR